MRSIPFPRRSLSRALIATGLLAASCASQAEETVLQEVSVVAPADSGEQRRNSSTAKIVFGRDELDTLDASSIGELLRKLPGTGLSADMESRRGRARGPDRHMPRILVDGQPLPGGDRNPAAALRLPADLIERIEIIRGSTAEFPSAAPGGTINLVLKDVPPKASKSARLGLGSFDGQPVLRGDGQFSEQQGEFGYLLAASFNSRPISGRRDTEIQRFAAGTRNAWTFEHGMEEGRDSNLSLAPRFNWNLGQGQQFTLSPFFSHTEDNRNGRIRRLGYADPVAGSGLANLGLDREEDDTRRSSGRLAAEWRSVQPGGSEWSARLLLQGESEERRKKVGQFNAAGGATGSSDEATRRLERETALILRGKRLFADAHVVTGGAEWRLAESDEKKDLLTNGVAQALGADGASSQEETRQVLWTQDEWQLADQHLLTPGLRWQLQRDRVVDGIGTVVEHHFRSLDPSLHYLWQPDPAWNFRSSGAINGQPPRIRDLSPVVKTATGTNSSGNPDRAGNPGLEAEKSRSLDVGIEHFLAGRKGTVGLSVYRRWIDNQIQRLTQLENGRWVERPFNVGDAVLNGGLLDFKTRGDAFGLAALSALTLRGNYALTRTRISDPAPGLGTGEGPRRNWNLGFDYEVPSYRLTFGSTLSYVSALDRESSATVRQTQGASRQVDVYALHKIDRQLSLRFSAQNVTGAGKGYDLRETDGTTGSLTRLEGERERGVPTFLLTLEGKW